VLVLESVAIIIGLRRKETRNVSPPKTFGKYTVTKLLSKQGDYVSIFLAQLATTEAQVELHVLNHPVNETSSEFQRFLNEFQTLSTLEHTNIVRVTDMGMQENKAYYATEYTDSRSVNSVVADGKSFTVEEIVELGCQVTDALEYMHKKKVIHRDIGPDTVYWDDTGARATISGFALVKNFRLTNLTARGICTPSEMRVTPEQVEDLPYDERTDLYLLGDLLYWLLTQRTALTLDFTPAKPSTHNEKVPDRLDKVILKLLKAKPDDRFQDATLVKQRLRWAIQDDEEL